MFVVPEIIATAFGWIGALSAVAAYGAVTMKRITADSATFQGLNLMGAALLCVSAYSHGAWPSAIVNVIWVGIGFFALRAIRRARHADPSAPTMTPADLIATELAAPEYSAADMSLVETTETVEPVPAEAPLSRDDVAIAA